MLAYNNLIMVDHYHYIPPAPTVAASTICHKADKELEMKKWQSYTAQP